MPDVGRFRKRIVRFEIHVVEKFGEVAGRWTPLGEMGGERSDDLLIMQHVLQADGFCCLGEVEATWSTPRQQQRKHRGAELLA